MKYDQVLAEASLGGDLYGVKLRIIHSEESIMSMVKRDASATYLSAWHQQLGHLGDMMLEKLVNSNSVEGMNIMDSCLLGTCKDCILGKMYEKPFENRQKQDSCLFGTLHAGLIGPMTPEARWTHVKFSLVVIDDCSGFGFVFNLKHKDEAVKVLIELDKTIETKFQARVHTFRTDNGGEFINNEMDKYCQNSGISVSTSVTYYLELNGCAER